MAGSQEFRESPGRRRRRLVIAWSQVFGAIGIGAMLHWWLTGRSDQALIATLGSFGILFPPLLNLARQYRQRSLAAVITQDGLGLVVGERGWKELKWSDVRSFELPSHPGSGKDHAFVNVRPGEPGPRSIRLPLQLLGPDLFDGFTNALRRYWPDIDETWQVQLRNRGLDSSAP